MEVGHALFSAEFRTACVSVEGRSALLFFDQASADSLKKCVESLKSKADSVRLGFYRDLLRNRPLHGPDGILVELVKP
ncbi:UNVERIFIED_ORG: hypothetical protein LHK14_18080 [Roseateles sp. XES5]|nr:hypothetical protein [Roseateles sp. XES5]